MSNRANYQHIPNIRLGQSKKTSAALSPAQRLRLKDAQTLLNNALNANSDTFCNVNLTNAYRTIRTLIQERISN